jgi:hypothetical protein
MVIQDPVSHTGIFRSYISHLKNFQSYSLQKSNNLYSASPMLQPLTSIQHASYSPYPPHFQRIQWLPSVGSSAWGVRRKACLRSLRLLKSTMAVSCDTVVLYNLQKWSIQLGWPFWKKRQGTHPNDYSSRLILKSNLEISAWSKRNLRRCSDSSSLYPIIRRV